MNRRRPLVRTIEGRASWRSRMLELWPQTLHAFQMAALLPESARALDRIVHFVMARTRWRDAVNSA
jgi:hypothetical protein